MLMVLGVHADFYAISNPILRYSIALFNDAGINCFVLISGYFGIRSSKKSFGSLLFIVFFYLCISYAGLVSGGRSEFSVKSMMENLNIIGHHWFLRAYIALYVFAPILNLFGASVTRKQYQIFLMSWIGVEFLLGYVVDYLNFNRGYSFQAFILLYLIGQYMKIHQVKWTSFSRRTDLLMFLAFTLAGAVLLVAASLIGKEHGAEYYLRAYNSPLMILASCYFFLFFSKIHFHNDFVNLLATSSFSVYVFHTTPWVYEPYRRFCSSIFSADSEFVGILLTCLFIFLVYVSIFLLDYTRKFLWNTIVASVNKQKQ